MNGPDHYRAAEELAGPRGEWYFANADDVPAILDRAKVHAILAVAAAVATNDRQEGMSVEQLAEWLGATGDMRAVRGG
jgi:hypothetical protein